MSTALTEPRLACRPGAAPPQRVAAARPLSPSALTAWLTCPALWWFRHALRLPDSSPRMAVGRAVHQVAAILTRCKQRGEQPEEAEIMDGTARALNMELEACSASDVETHGRAELHASAAAYVACFTREVLPTLDAAQIEQPLSGTIDGVPIAGVADVITADGVVCDLKTTSRKPSGISGAHKHQLTLYAACAGLSTGRIISLVQTTRSTSAIAHTEPITAPDFDHLGQTLPVIRDAMQQGLIWANRTALSCSRTNCGHWRACEREFGGEVRS